MTLAPRLRWRLSGAPLATRTTRTGNSASADLPGGAYGRRGCGTPRRWSSCRTCTSCLSLGHPRFCLPLFAEIIRQVYRVPIYACPKYPYLWAFELPGEDLPIHQYHPPEARLEAPVHRFWPLRLVFR